MSDSVEVENAKTRLVNALSRQERSYTDADFFADERAINAALDDLVRLGKDRGTMLDQAHSRIARERRRAI